MIMLSFDKEVHEPHTRVSLSVLCISCLIVQWVNQAAGVADRPSLKLCIHVCIHSVQGEHCLGRVRELWMRLSQTCPDVHFATKV